MFSVGSHDVMTTTKVIAKTTCSMGFHYQAFHCCSRFDNSTLITAQTLITRLLPTREVPFIPYIYKFIIRVELKQAVVAIETP